MVAIEIPIILIIVGVVGYIGVQYGEVFTEDITNYASDLSSYVPDTSPLELANTAKELFEEQTTTFLDGMEISHVYQVQKSSDDANPLDTLAQNSLLQEQHQTVPVNYTAEQVAQLQPVEQEQPLVQAIPTYVIGVKPFPEIQGYIKIKDPVTGKILIPYIYKTLITISCRSSMQFCALTDVVRWIQTEDGGKDANDNDLGGFYYYKWPPSHPTDILEGLYDACINVTSLEKNSFGIYPSNKHCYQIRMTH